MNMFDIVIVGGGPAGLSAGIYGGRSKLKTLIIEKGQVGGQVFSTRELVNYPGFAKNTSGPDLINNMYKHAIEFGVEFLKDEVVNLLKEDNIITISTNKGEKLLTKTVILAPGSQPRLLNIKGEQELKGSGVSYCATCDAEFYEDLTVVVVGNGDAAIEEAIYLTKYAEKVIVLVIHEEGKVDCNKYSATKAFKNPKIEFKWNSILHEIKGKYEVEGVVIKNIKNGLLTEINADGVFIYIGTTPRTDFSKGIIDMDENGYILVNERMETSMSGVFCAGDARQKYLRQVVTAANDGAIAAVSAEKYIQEEEEYKKDILNSETPVFLYFWSPLIKESITLGSDLERYIEKTYEKINFIKIDTSRKTLIANIFKITQIPSLLLIENGLLKENLTNSINDYV